MEIGKPSSGSAQWAAAVIVRSIVFNQIWRCWAPAACSPRRTNSTTSGKRLAADAQGGDRDMCHGSRTPHGMATRIYCDQDADDLVKTTHKDFVSLVRQIPLARAGGEDGKLGEFLRAVSPDQQGYIFELINKVLTGVSLVPSSWTRATVTLIPKILLARVRTYYRPITPTLVVGSIFLPLLGPGLFAWVQGGLPSSGACPSRTCATTREAELKGKGELLEEVRR